MGQPGLHQRVFSVQKSFGVFGRLNSDLLCFPSGSSRWQMLGRSSGRMVPSLKIMGDTQLLSVADLPSGIFGGVEWMERNK